MCSGRYSPAPIDALISPPAGSGSELVERLDHVVIWPIFVPMMFGILRKVHRLDVQTKGYST